VELLLEAIKPRFTAAASFRWQVAEQDNGHAQRRSCQTDADFWPREVVHKPGHGHAR